VERDGIIIMMVIAAGLPMAICLLLALSGRRRAAWTTVGAVVAVAVAIPVLLHLQDTHGQAGLAGVIIVVVLLGPAVVGAVLGAGLGHLLSRLR